MAADVLSQAEKARPPPIAAAEWRARLELAPCYRAFHVVVCTGLILNHITLTRGWRLRGVGVEQLV